MKDCVFCKIVARDIPADIVYEDDDSISFLDIRPVNPGHALVIPKRHFENLYELPSDLAGRLFQVAQRIAPAVRDVTGSDGINIGMDNGSAAGQEVFHAHIHVMPRRLDDGYALWHGKAATPDELAPISEKLREALRDKPTERGAG